MRTTCLKSQKCVCFSCLGIVKYTKVKTSGCTVQHDHMLLLQVLTYLPPGRLRPSLWLMHKHCCNFVLFPGRIYQSLSGSFSTVWSACCSCWVSVLVLELTGSFSVNFPPWPKAETSPILQGYYCSNAGTDSHNTQIKRLIGETLTFNSMHQLPCDHIDGYVQARGNLCPSYSDAVI